MHIEAALPLVTTRPSEAARALQGAYQMVSEQLASLDPGSGTASSSTCSPEAIASMRNLLEDSSLQLVRLMMSCHLSSGGHTAVLALALSYLGARGFIPGTNEASATVDPIYGSDTGSGGQAVFPKAGSISWDVWMLSVKSRCALKQSEAILAEVRQAIALGCGVKVIEAVLQLLIQPLKQASGHCDGVCRQAPAVS